MSPDWPANRGADVPSVLSHAKEQLLGVLRQKSGSRLQIFCLAHASRFDRDRGSDRIAIAFLSSQRKAMELPDILHRVVQDAQLRGIAVFQDHFQPPVMIDVRQRKRAAVLQESPSNRARTSVNVPSRLLTNITFLA